MRFQVPQYLDIEDKIIGPLTLKQFIYLLVGGGVIFLLYTILKFSVFILVAIPVGFFVILLAFYKIGNQKFIYFVTSFLGFISKPNIYIWKKFSSKKAGIEIEPVSKIIKKGKPIKQAPEKSGLQDLWWKVEISKPKNSAQTQNK